MNGQSRLERHLAGYESATTVMSSELETTSFCDSDDDDTMSRFEAKGKRTERKCSKMPCFFLTDTNELGNCLMLSLLLCPGLVVQQNRALPLDCLSATADAGNSVLRGWRGYCTPFFSDTWS